MRYSIRARNRIERYSVRYSKFCNIRTLLVETSPWNENYFSEPVSWVSICFFETWRQIPFRNGPYIGYEKGVLSYRNIRWQFVQTLSPYHLQSPGPFGTEFRDCSPVAKVSLRPLVYASVMYAFMIRTWHVKCLMGLRLRLALLDAVLRSTAWTSRWKWRRSFKARPFFHRNMAQTLGRTMHRGGGTCKTELDKSLW